MAQASLLSICRDVESASAGPAPVSTDSTCDVPFRWTSPQGAGTCSPSTSVLVPETLKQHAELGDDSPQVVGVPSLSGTRNHEPRRGWEQKKKTTLGGSLSLEAAGSRCPTGPSRDCSLRSKHHLWFEGCGFYAVEMEAVGMATFWSQDVLLLSLWSGTSPPHAEPVPSPLWVTLWGIKWGHKDKVHLVGYSQGRCACR